jgi:nitrite reductase (NO-forming)
MVPQHVTNGVYGMIWVEPEDGMPKADREFYVIQGELYTAPRHDAPRLQEFSLEKLLAENPDHIMFNGTTDALTKTHKMEANTGENVRIYFGVGGPNLTSSFHVIGEIFDKVYEHGTLSSPPLADLQTILVPPPGGGAMVEFKVDYPGRYILVDHALSRMEKGLAVAI